MGYVTFIFWANEATLSWGSSKSTPSNVKGRSLKACQTSVSKCGISARHTPHQEAVNCRMYVVPSSDVEL